MSMRKIHELLDHIPVPEVICAHQRFDDTHLDAPKIFLMDQLDKIRDSIHPGMRVAITGGSRGIARYSELMETIVEFIRRQGAAPFIVPSMGSHGGGTAEGQIKVLNSLGITEETAGAPIVSSMDTVKIGVTSRGLPVYIDRNAFEADGIILFNRIKPHPAFHGDYESGLVKMMAIGLAKHKGAELTHSLRMEHMAENIVEVAKLTLAQAPILCGIGTVENGYGEIAQIHVLKKEEILEREPAILNDARRLAPRIYLDNIDALIVCKNGKDISGSGTDPNITGMHVSAVNSSGPKTTAMGILDLTEKTGKNAHGIGLADFITRRIYDKMDITDSYINVLTSLSTKAAKIPIVLESDRMVFQACVKVSGVLDQDDLKLVIIEDTKHLETVYLSRGALNAVVRPDAISTNGGFSPVPFDSSGNLLLFQS